jgi:hypothetical protein
MNETLAGILSALFISIGVIYYSSKFANILDEKQFMVKALFMILFLLILLFICDNIFFSKEPLLSNEIRLSLFGLIEKLLLIMFGFYFGQTQNKE